MHDALVAPGRGVGHIASHPGFTGLNRIQAIVAGEIAPVQVSELAVFAIR